MLKKTYFLLLGLSLCCQGLKAQTGQPFITPPYLQIGYQPSATSLELLWHSTDSSTNWEVETKAVGTNTWKKTSPPEATRVAVANIGTHFVYRTLMTGLLSGSDFHYRILKNKKLVFSARGKAPKEKDQPYRFVAFGDIGAGTPSAKALAQQAYGVHPDLVVVPGDIVYERGLISEYRTKFWPVYNADTTSAEGAPLMRSIPFVAAMGNHDGDTRDLNNHPDALAYYAFWDQPLNGLPAAEGSAVVPFMKATPENKKAFETAAGKAYPVMSNFSFNYGNTHWTVIDSDTYVDWTDSTLLKWVANDLESAKDAVWKMVVFHHPGFSSARDHFEQQQMRLLSPILEAGHVDVVLNGHVHNYQRSFPMRFAPDKKGTLLVGGKDNKTIRGRVVNGKWTLDKTFDGQSQTKPAGIIYLVTGAGGQELYNVDQQTDTDSWQPFTHKFISDIHSFTVADVNGNKIIFRQLSEEGKELDTFTISK
ncbi:metallophosphoesterase [Chitinophaga qingshengii]|uniref:Metallophosphoesterase n=1 Tax=Chitinophaga qingshengii TaxID=1569794 RepID=A0ABR7TUQ0_9BACT|nr:metallophosphoesterase [Chitinophaga qingshengii]MBC9934157.1 metallophosphoesterase [Chitinophaga qingshengii]